MIIGMNKPETGIQSMAAAVKAFSSQQYGRCSVKVLAFSVLLCEIEMSVACQPAPWFPQLPSGQDEGLGVSSESSLPSRKDSN